MVEIIIQFETHTFGLTTDADKNGIPRWRGIRQSLNSFLVFNATAPARRSFQNHIRILRNVSALSTARQAIQRLEIP
jgi:hypothetical protein